MGKLWVKLLNKSHQRDVHLERYLHYRLYPQKWPLIKKKLIKNKFKNIIQLFCTRKFVHL